jgi:hypothetical protein
MTKKYISDHDVLNFDVSMDEALFVHVRDTMEELSQYLDDLFFLENLKLGFQAK